MKTLELDIYNGSKIKIDVDKNSNIIDIRINTDYYVIDSPNAPFEYKYNRLENIFKISNDSFKILDYTTMILKKNKKLFNELNVMIIKKDDADEIYIIVRRAFTHQHMKTLDVQTFLFELRDRIDDFRTFDYRLPNNDKVIKLGKTIDSSLIGIQLGSGKIEYIQCNADSNSNYMNKLLKDFYNYNNTIELINKGSIVFLNSSVNKNKILEPRIPAKRTTLGDFINLCNYHNNIYCFIDNEWHRFYRKNNTIIDEKI